LIKCSPPTCRVKDPLISTSRAIRDTTDAGKIRLADPAQTSLR
jgi:hypothetical protein